MTLIDLGEVGRHDPRTATPDPPPPWLRKLGEPARGKAAAVAVLAVLAGGLAGIAPATDPLPVIRTVPALDYQGSFWSFDGTVVQLSPDSRSASAIELATGRTAWSIQFGGPVWRMERFFDDVIVVQHSPEPGYTGEGESEDTIFRFLAEGWVAMIDPRTGAERWRRDGALLSPYGAPAVILLQPVAHSPAASSAAEEDPAARDMRVVAVDPQTGRDRWGVPVSKSMRWSFVFGDDYFPIQGGLVLMESHDGSIIEINSGGGTTPRGRIAPGGDLTWASTTHLAVTRPAGFTGFAGNARVFELYEGRTLTDRPLWTVMLDDGTPAPWPCGVRGRLCRIQDGNLVDLSLSTGTVVGPHEESVADLLSPATLGNWSPVGPWIDPSEHLVSLPAGLSKTGVAWLGHLRAVHGQVRITPLMSMRLQVTSCWPPDDTWLICSGAQRDGSSSDRSIVLRRSDVDALIRRLAPPS